MIEMYNEIKEEADRFRTFEDSLLSNPNFRKRVLEKAGTVTEIKDVKRKQGDELTRKIKDFQKRYKNRQTMITKQWLYHSSSMYLRDGKRLLCIISVFCMACPVLVTV